MKWFFIVCQLCVTIFFCLVLGSFFSQKAYAATFNCTTTTSGTWNWNVAGNWTPGTCNATYPGGTGGADVYNVAINSVVATTININVDLTNIGTITIIGNGVAHTVNFNGHTVTTSSTTAVNAPTAAVSNTIAVDTGIFNAGGNITLTAGSASTRVAQITASTGTINITGSVVYGGTAAGAKVSVTSTGNVITDSVGANGLFSEAASTGSLKLTGNSPTIQTGANYTYNNVEFAGSGTAVFNGTKTLNGTLTITSGTLDFGANAITVTGTTEVVNGATAQFSSATNTKILIGAVTLDSGSTWDNSANSAVTYRGGFTNNGATTLTIGTGTQTFNTNAQNVGGTSSISIPNMTVTGVVVTVTYTSSSPSLTVTTLLSGTGTLRQSSGGYLTLGGSATITTLDNTTNTPNTVEYTGGGTPTIKGTTYDYLIFSGSGNGTLSTTTTVNNDLTISAGTVTTGGNSMTVTGATSVTGTLSISSTTGTKTFGDITINNGGTMSFGAAEAITMNGSLQIDGTGAISGTTGAWTFQDASSGTISGSTGSTQTLASATFTGAYTVSIPLTFTTTVAVTGVTVINNSTIVVGTNLTGVSGTLQQGSNASLNIGGTSTITTLDASATDNTVNYTGGGAQTIKTPSSSTYYNLTYSGSNTGSLAADVILGGTLTISSGTFATASHNMTIGGDFNHSGGAFTQGTSTETFVDPTQTSNIKGTTTFYRITSIIPNKSLVFTHGLTTTVTNLLTLNGQSCESPISVTSDSSGNPFTLTAPAGSNVSYLTVKDSTSTNAITATTSTSVSGNNGNWSISSGICAGQTTAWSFQRKTFYDSSHGLYWRFSYDGSQINGEYNASPWNSNWVASSSIATSTNDFSLWNDGTFIFIAYISGNDVVVRKGTPGASSISWGSANVALDGTSTADMYMYPNISEDSAGVLWVTATYNNSSSALSYSVKTISSSASQNPASWNAANSMSNTNSTNADIYGVTVSRGSQNMLTVYEVNGTVYSQLYSNGSGYAGAVSITATASTGIDKNFSVTSDTSNNVHMVVVDTSNFVQYYKYTGSWSASTRLDTSATNQYPSIAIDTGTNDVYAIYYRSSRIYYKQFHGGGWGSETNTSWTTSATSVNLGLNYSDNGYIFGVWQTGSSPYVANFNNILLPAGFLTINAPSSATLSSVAVATSTQNSTGSLGVTTVTDYRGVMPGWSLTITVSNFTGGGHTIAVTNFGVNPSNSTLTAVVGSLTGLSSGPSHTFSGTNDPANIVTASSGSGQGQYTINPDLSLSVPVGSYFGSYTATVTETVQ